MIKNYFKIAWRSLWKNKFYTMLNIGGLSVGLATGIMLLLWIQNELSFDKFHKDYQNIYQISSHFKDNGEDATWTIVPGPLAVYAKSIPGVVTYVRILEKSDQLLSDKKRNKIFAGNTIAYVDSGFFSIFSFPLVKGNSKNLFTDINSVVITQSTAKKLFGNEDAIGQVISFSKSDFIVRGVIKDFESNSSLQYDALFPMGFYAKEFTADGGNGNWKTIDADLGNYSFSGFVKLQPNVNPQKIGKLFSSAYKTARNGITPTSFKLQNIADIHLIGADGNNASLRVVQIFIMIMMLLLAIASINYVNLSTARSLIKAKEVSVRKIIGASKLQLFFQFIIETILLFFIATIFAIVLIFLFMPIYNTISGKILSFSFLDFDVWTAFGIAVLGTLIASSVYPAMLLSSFKPIEALKGKFISGIGMTSVRKALVVFQFSISVILLICTMMMTKQMEFIKNKDLGYDKNYTFSVPLPWDARQHTDAIKTELKNHTEILDVATSDAVDFSSVDGSTSDLEWPTKPSNTNMIITQLSVDADFIPTLKIEMAEGKNFFGTPADNDSYILNETAVRKMGLKKPYVGQQIAFHSHKGEIIGVVKDFNFKSLKDNVSPLIFYTFISNRNILYVRTTAAHSQEAIGFVEKEYKKYASDIPFSYSFLDQSFQAKYKSEERSGILFNVFSCIAIFISCLGLFGLSTYTVQIKTKEIGIRKVLGASVNVIIELVSKDFLKLIFVSIIIAIPIAWYIITQWLADFAYRTAISWWVFALAGLVAVLIALCTISFQAIKAALANPVKSLKTE